MHRILVCLILLFTSCATQAPAVPKPIEVAVHPNGDRLELYAESSPLCKSAQLLRAVYTYRKNVEQAPQLSGTSVEGCYKIEDNVVYSIFVDGDTVTLPLCVFRNSCSEQRGQRRTRFFY